MASSHRNFVHDPLDHTEPSIRLVEIQPQLSEDGLIQCNLFHATIDAEYTCLSYMWGPESPTAVILLNGKEFHVRKNLFDFLKMAITHNTSVGTWVFWIDAICIDQANIAERQHQVLQMGEIYAEAQEVIAWLGICHMPKIPSVLEQLSGLVWVWTHQFSAEERDFLDELASDLHRYLFDNPYWNRAWITQEIKLARNCTVIIDSTWMRLETVRAWHSYYQSTAVFGPTAFNPLLHPINRIEPRYSRPLITLLATYEDRKCSIPQDRIFSLLSLCSERSAIVVDYELPRLDLMLNVLNASPDRLCICSIDVVRRALELPGPECSKVKLQKQILWLSFDLRPENQPLWNGHHLLATASCTLTIDLPSLCNGYAAWYKEKLWKATFRLQDRVEHVIYWGEECMMDMPVYYKRRGSDGQESGRRVLCRYGDGLDLSGMDNNNGKFTLRITLKVFMEIVAGTKHGLCDVAKFGRNPSFHNKHRPEVTIGYHGCKGAWKD